ncbi:hypothetical protein T03_17137 [Trichinella britovi]|uniref:FLYWCH-type domain-containing protein n=1 Tax=Trichinella britovi TaxID=45882 RepID=A0A0V0YVS9_TRIBR|nr:hypothetical protein T03_17137 [Trichinella britovi]
MIAKWLFKTECNTVEFISPVFREPTKIVYRGRCYTLKRTNRNDKC